MQQQVPSPLLGKRNLSFSVVMQHVTLIPRKNAARLTCRALRVVMDDCTRCLRWTGPVFIGDSIGDNVPSHETAQFGGRDRPKWQEVHHHRHNTTCLRQPCKTPGIGAPEQPAPKRIILIALSQHHPRIIRAKCSQIYLFRQQRLIVVKHTAQNTAGTQGESGGLQPRMLSSVAYNFTLWFQS